MHAFQLLASDDSNLVVKLIPFIIFLAIWGLGAVASAVNKVKEEARRRQVRSQMSLPPMIAQGSMKTSMRRATTLKQRPGPARRAPVPPRILPRAKLPPLPQMARSAPPQRKVPAAPPPLRQPSPPRTSSQGAQATPAPPRAQGARPTAATAVALSKWLRPQTLRAQFILTEILRPPLGMRESHE